jgi:uncharacterized RDD family membrane protein YckC
MRWYYKLDAQKIGPITEEEVEKLVKNGTITSSTPVWNDLSGKWMSYGEAKGGAAAAPSQAGASATAACAECGRTFPLDDMVQYGQHRICAACKPAFFQKLQEGASLPNSMVYAGFWMRFGAKFIDGLIQYAINMAISVVMTGVLVSVSGRNPGARGGAMLAVFGLQMAFAASYSTFFVGKFQATPGKMALGIKIVAPDGGRIGYGRALGRYFAEFLSSIILCIGYLMAAFDQEKRALHDRICTTRVVRK